MKNNAKKNNNNAAAVVAAAVAQPQKPTTKLTAPQQKAKDLEQAKAHWEKQLPIEFPHYAAAAANHMQSLNALSTSIGVIDTELKTAKATLAAATEAANEATVDVADDGHLEAILARAAADEKVKTLTAARTQKITDTAAALTLLIAALNNALDVPLLALLHTGKTVGRDRATALQFATGLGVELDALPPFGAIMMAGSGLGASPHLHGRGPCCVDPSSLTSPRAVFIAIADAAAERLNDLCGKELCCDSCIPFARNFLRKTEEQFDLQRDIIDRCHRFQFKVTCCVNTRFAACGWVPGDADLTKVRFSRLTETATKWLAVVAAVIASTRIVATLTNLHVDPALILDPVETSKWAKKHTAELMLVNPRLRLVGEGGYSESDIVFKFTVCRGGDCKNQQCKQQIWKVAILLLSHTNFPAEVSDMVEKTVTHRLTVCKVDVTGNLDGWLQVQHLNHRFEFDKVVQLNDTAQKKVIMNTSESNKCRADIVLTNINEFHNGGNEKAARRLREGDAVGDDEEKQEQEVEQDQAAAVDGAGAVVGKNDDDDAEAGNGDEDEEEDEFDIPEDLEGAEDDNNGDADPFALPGQNNNNGAADGGGALEDAEKDNNNANSNNKDNKKQKRKKKRNKWLIKTDDEKQTKAIVFTSYDWMFVVLKMLCLINNDDGDIDINDEELSITVSHHPRAQQLYAVAIDAITFLRSVCTISFTAITTTNPPYHRVILLCSACASSPATIMCLRLAAPIHKDRIYYLKLDTLIEMFRSYVRHLVSGDCAARQHKLGEKMTASNKAVAAVKDSVLSLVRDMLLPRMCFCLERPHQRRPIVSAFQLTQFLEKHNPALAQLIEIRHAFHEDRARFYCCKATAPKSSCALGARGRCCKAIAAFYEEDNNGRNRAGRGMCVIGPNDEPVFKIRAVFQSVIEHLQGHTDESEEFVALVKTASAAHERLAAKQEKKWHKVQGTFDDENSFMKARAALGAGDQ